MDLPVPEGQKKDKSFASHSTMSKSFGLQRKTLARVIGLEKRVDKIESGSGGINIDKFTELNKGIVSVNNNLKAIKKPLRQGASLLKFYLLKLFKRLVNDIP